MKVLLWQHLPFVPALYFTHVVKLSTRINDIKSIFFVVIQQSPHPSCTHFAVCATHSPRARDGLLKYLVRLLRYTGEGIQWIWEAEGSWVLQGWPCLAELSLFFLMSSWWSPASPGHWSLHISWWKGRHGDEQEKCRWEVAAKGKLWACCWRGRGSGDNGHGRCWRTQCHPCLDHSSMAFLQQSQAPETHGNVWSKEELLSLEETQFREHLNQLDI